MKQLNKRRLAIFAALTLLLLAALAAFPSSTLAATTRDEGVNAAASSAPAQWYNCFYNVRRADTLYSLAVRNRTTVWTLMQLNGLRSNLIFAGMTLRIPCPEPTPTPPPPSGICSYYVVQRGDYLKLIAARFGVSYEDIAKVNRIYNPSVIYAGMRLAIPCPHAPPPSTGWKNFTSVKNHFTFDYPANWQFDMNTASAGPGRDPEYIYLRPSATTLPVVLVYAQKFAPPITGFENCYKNLIFRGVPACSIELPRGQNPAQRLLVFQRGDVFFQLSALYEDPRTLGTFDDIVRSFMFTR